MDRIIRKNPIVRILIPFMIGIISGYKFSIPDSVLYTLSFGLIIILAIFNFNKKFISNYKLRWINGFLLLMLWFITGAILVYLHSYSDRNFTEDKKEKTYYGKIISMPENAKAFRKMEIKLQAYKSNDKIIQLNEKIIAYIPNDSLSEKLGYGDFILFKTKLHLIKNKGNPDEFDYAGFMAKKKIFRSAFLQSDAWKTTGRNEGSFIIKIAHLARNNLLHILKRNGITGKEFAVVSALTLGYKAELDEPTKSAFVASGAMHIMAVSGLHVGIIQLILNYLLIFLKRFKRGSTIKVSVIILTLWAYALITGLSPSVTRAAIMFSLIQIGISFRRDISIFNIIAVAALLILLFEPMQLFDVGFQFSFLAVSGIVFLHSKIYKLITFKNLILDKAWAITVASFAAQLSLGPLSIYYFNQFPNYFLLSNLIIIPATFLIITFTIALFAFSVTPLVSIFAYILKKLALFLILFVEFIQGLPYSQSTGIFLDLSEVLLLYGFIILIIALFIRKKAIYLIAALTLLILYQSKTLLQTIENKNSSKIVVFNLNKSSAIFVHNSSHSYLICDSLLANDSISRNFYFKRFLSHKKSYDCELINIQKSAGMNVFYKNIITSGNNSILVLQDDYYKGKTSNKLQIDYVLVRNNADYSIKEMQSLFNFKEIIIAADNNWWLRKKWKEECLQKGISFYDIKEQGAFICE